MPTDSASFEPSRFHSGASGYGGPTTAPRRPSGMLNKVPEVTLAFWVIKILSTTSARPVPTTWP
jgi:hypothetical protein